MSVVRLQNETNVRDRYTRLSVFVIVILALFGLADCSPESSANSLGDAYVAPASLNLRSNLAFKSTTVAVLKHGQHLAVIDVKRRFVQVRTDKGAVGWLDSRQLLSKEEMDQFRKNTARALLLASQGKATTFDILNVHIDPDRHSPAFAQIPAAGTVEVLAHKAVPRPTGPAPAERPSFLKPPPKVVKRKRAKPSKSNSLVPPMPPPPAPPENWQELSKGPNDEQSAQKAKEEAARKAAEEAARQRPVVLEDWNLIRTPDKVVGWVLARNLYMSIPDEVAQYAEGQRISSYFDLGAVEDAEKGTKHDWLWTTSSKPQPFDFDRFRVFYWNRRRHRYETSYRQRDLTGYFPVKVERAPDGDHAFFTMILQDGQGGFVQKRYSFDGTLVHLVSTEPYTPPSGNSPTKAAPLEPEKMKPRQPKGNWFRRQYQKLKQMIKRR